IQLLKFFQISLTFLYRWFLGYLLCFRIFTTNDVYFLYSNLVIIIFHFKPIQIVNLLELYLNLKEYQPKLISNSSKNLKKDTFGRNASIV
ncbi:hypothetical protein BpHYR1_039468, partial [Brachionus plicatilis]